MKVQVWVELDISDDVHPDHAGRLIDSGLSEVAGNDLRSWQIMDILPESLDTL